MRGLRLQTALALYQIEAGKTAASLKDLIPRCLPELPLDPFTGKGFHYRISRGERIIQELKLWQPFLPVSAGQGIVWSVGPDREDNGGENQGRDDRSPDPQVWARLGLDMIFVVPQWRER
jgi:hypothetical protein